MAAYLTKAEFQLRSLIPPEFIDAIEAVQVGWTDAQLTQWSRWMDSRLGKRYAAPFESPYPEAIKGWLNRIVTLKAWLRRGVDPNDEQFQEIKQDHDNAMAEIKEAADANTNNFDLPVSDLVVGSGIVKQFPMVYSEQSPYVGLDLQRETARDEDYNGSGSS